jgi:hypothetical protein
MKDINLFGSIASSAKNVLNLNILLSVFSDIFDEKKCPGAPIFRPAFSSLWAEKRSSSWTR